MLENRLVHSKEQQARRDRHLELQRRLTALEAKRPDFVKLHQTVAKRIGISLQFTEQELFILLEKLNRWLETRERLAGEQAALAETCRQHAACLKAVNEALMPYSFPPAADHDAAAALVEHLERLHQEHQAALQQRAQAHKDLERARRRLSDVQDEQTSLLAPLGLTPDDRTTLHTWCRQFEAYQQTVQTLQEHQTLARREEERLRTLPLFEAELLTVSAAALAAEIRQRERQAEEVESLQEEIAGIEARIRRAEQDRDLEQARYTYEESLHALADEHGADLRRTLGWLITQHVRQETRDQELPAVFHKARALFGQITRGRYRLRMDEATQAFRAYDTVKERGFALNELSSGTRVQLLLAVRIAFVERQEQGVQLPLLMDETLANSDDVKARAIIDAVIALCENGRQVFYFTAREDEVTKWVQRTAPLEGITCRVLSLDAETTPETLQQRTLPAPFLDTAVPPPEGRGHAAYRALLNIPPWDAHQPVGSLHLWYVLEDPNGLYTLLRQGLSQWGPLTTLYPDPAGIPDLPEGVGARAVAYVDALQAWQHGWRIGRPRPVDRAVLQEADAISDIFLDRVNDLCTALQGDGAALVHALRNGGLKGFRSHKADELEAYLHAHGYITDQVPLSPEELRARYLRAVEPALARHVLTLDQLDTFFNRLHRQVG